MFNLNLGGVVAGLGVALSGFFTFIAPVVVKLMEWGEQLFKTFLTGLSIIFSNVSTWIVIISMIIASSLYTMRWDNNRAIAPYKEDVSELENAIKQLPPSQKKYLKVYKDRSGHYKKIVPKKQIPYLSPFREGGN